MKKNIGILLVLILVLSACGGNSNEGKNGLPKKITVGTIRVPNDKSVAMQKGFFTEYFEDKGIEVEFLFFDSGTAANVAFASGDLDFAGMGYTNAVVALSKDINVELIWIHEVLGANEALVVQNDSKINSAQDLKGKKIATPFSSTSHYSLMKYLEKNDMTSRDVTLLDMNTQDIFAAWSRGDLDATYTWEPTLSKIKESGRVIVDSEQMSKDGVSTVNIELVNKAFSSKYPELVEDYIRALSKAVDLYKNSPDEAIQAASDYLKFDKDEVKSQMQGTIWLTREEELSSEYLGTEKTPGAFHNTFYETAEFLLEERKIDKVPTMEEINGFINSKYIEDSLN
ncbi:MAG: ABC transporter substrate-binding protein [Tissierellia bacterium]|nr:ABC transporter substrate-binding protein [Tissierellia bacterium]